ncbi:MAG TPA: protein phosphatase 2C domain-containing protein [Jatrophihabitantaceae bacterium]|jgi:protein phosphatase
MAFTLRFAVRSDLGLVRSNNEDSVYAGPRLLAIADGMGGHAAGEVASKLVIGVLEPLDEDRPFPDLLGELRDTVLEANVRIAEAVQKDSELEGMGTTLTALRFVGAQVGLVHVGDSRAYLLRGDLLSQITHDDTYVQFLVDSGKITPDEAKDHPRKSVILRALLGAEVEPDVSIREARPGDRYLLCTDGLTDVVSTETIGETMRIADPQESADRLVELALRGGGPDNVTVIVADVVEGPASDDVPVIAGALIDPSAADAPTDDSPAERAARIGRTEPPPAAAPVRKRRRVWRTPLIVAAILAVIIGGLAGAYALTQTYYFVGKDGAEVAIFRGVNTQIGPLKFFDVYRNTNLLISELNPSVRTQVSDGINASSEKDAEKIVQNLQGQLLPICPTATPSPTPTPTPTHKTSAKSTAKTTAHVTTHPATHTTSRATSSAAPTPTSSAPVIVGGAGEQDTCRQTR